MDEFDSYEVEEVGKSSLKNKKKILCFSFSVQKILSIKDCTLYEQKIRSDHDCLYQMVLGENDKKVKM